MINRLDFAYQLPIKRAVSGFSLLELVLVLFLMGTVMLTSLFLVDGADDQARYEETKNKLAMIKRAIVGDATRTINGEPEISGFVADMGRLPACIRELVDGKCVDSDPTPPLWALDVASGLWAGWRGPYVETAGSAVFRDGWGNKHTDEDEDASNFGWELVYLPLGCTVPDCLEMTVKSLGKDGASGVTAEDYTADVSININRHDYEVNLMGWNLLNLRFNNASSAVKIAEIDLLRLKFNTIDDGAINTMLATDLERNGQGFLSLTFPEENLILIPSTGVIPVTTGTMTIPVGSSLDATTLTVADGVLTFSAGRVNLAPCILEDCILPVKAGEIIVPAGTTLGVDGITLTLGAGNFTLPASIVAPIDVGIKSDNLAAKVGVHSLTILCNKVDNQYDAKRYDGNCEADLSDPPVNEPYSFKLAPRQAAPLKPNPLIWTIK
ncbi:MAG: hypothetical protein Q8N02_02815 [Methylotenera sp.]|nr:hypothetical protein [Methylotenera sp.]MDP2402991.1 hypothetical protein [Methylotenera sp.]MDP3094497.1 hypothetical protein [Methylotenera sp.]MDZ4223531.1 hypothetical protein [Methylotenera sp.]